MAYKSRYAVELWSRNGTRIADITHLLSSGFSYAEERNNAEDLSFSLNLDAFEDYLIDKVGADPVSNFREGQTEIKVRENGDYLFGTQLYYAPIDISPDDLTLSIQATGYLNFYKDLYPAPGKRYDQVDGAEIAADLIRQAELMPNADHGVTIDPDHYRTGVPRDREYGFFTSSVKLNVQRLTNLANGNFDFRIDADKVWRAYPAIGSPRSDFRVVLDRKHKHSTLDGGRLNRGANNLYNQIIGIGSGFGEDVLSTVQDDPLSQVEFGLRQKPVQFNEVSEMPTLVENTLAELERWKRLLRMPQVTLSGADLPATRIEIGDLIPLEFRGRRLLEDSSGIYRVERKVVTVDANHFIKSMTLYFDKTEGYY